MDLGVVIGWLNTVLIGALGLAVLFSRRWRHLKWFPVYALSICLLAVVYKLWLFTADFSLATRLIGELLCLAAVAEALRKDANKQPTWLWFALAGLTVVPFLPRSPAPNLRFQACFSLRSLRPLRFQQICKALIN